MCITERAILSADPPRTQIMYFRTLSIHIRFLRPQTWTCLLKPVNTSISRKYYAAFDAVADQIDLKESSESVATLGFLKTLIPKTARPSHRSERGKCFRDPRATLDRTNGVSL